MIQMNRKKAVVVSITLFMFLFVSSFSSALAMTVPKEQYVEAVIIFKPNVIVRIHNIEIEQQYNALNGITAKIPLSQLRRRSPQ